MTLNDLTFPVDIEFARSHALVFSESLSARLAELQGVYGTANCRVSGAPLPNGRYYCYAEVLTEVMPGGMLHAMWSAADLAVLLPSVEVVPLDEILSLLPAGPPDPVGSL